SDTSCDKVTKHKDLLLGKFIKVSSKACTYSILHATLVVHSQRGCVRQRGYTRFCRILGFLFNGKVRGVRRTEESKTSLRHLTLEDCRIEYFLLLQLVST